MKKIVKYLCYCLPLLGLAMGCNNDDGLSEFQPDTNKSGEVTLLASIENASSRASMIATGEARWLRNDAIAVLCNDNSIEVFTLDGTGETRKALFKGTVEGKTVGEYAFYPASVTYADGLLSYTLPSEVTATSAGECSLMAGKINEKNEVEFKQFMAYINLKINGVSSSTNKIVVSADNNLSGAVSVDVNKGMESGLPATAGDATLSILIPDGASSAINAIVAIPVGDYTSLVATAYDKNGNKEGETVLISGLTAITRGLLLSGELAVEGRKPIPGTVDVAGIYWATGNLEYEVGGQSSEGFAEGWRIAPHTAHHYHIASGGGDLKDLTDYNKVAHFNFGGIASPFDNKLESAAALATLDPAFEFSGKMYTDRHCTSATTDFAAAKFGDLAYWASNGKYRTPSAADFVALYTLASRVQATYTLDGFPVKGTYFTNPIDGGEPVIDTETVKELTDEDLQVGLFLPWSGRAYAANDFWLYGVNSIGVYRTSTVNLNSTVDATNGTIYRVSNLVEKESNSKGLNGAFYHAGWGANGRYAIRPIYIDGNYSPEPEPEPDPTPTPDPDPTPEPEPEPEQKPELGTLPSPAPVEGDWGANTPGGSISENPYGGGDL